jgi:hypothetical protein
VYPSGRPTFTDLPLQNISARPRPTYIVPRVAMTGVIPKGRGPFRKRQTWLSGPRQSHGTPGG